MTNGKNPSHLLVLPPLKPRYHRWLNPEDVEKAQVEWNKKWLKMLELNQKVLRDNLSLSQADFLYLEKWHSQYPK